MGVLDSMKFSRLREGLARTREGLVTKVARLVMGKSKIDDDFVRQLEEILITADVGVETTFSIIEKLRERSKREHSEGPAQLERIVREEIAEALANSPAANTGFNTPDGIRPYVIMIVGVNGVGKTTTIGKLAYNFRMMGKDVMMAAADTFRAAANEQLEIWAERAGVQIVRQIRGTDPAAVAFDAVKSAQSRGTDIVIIDTAGRLHTKSNLMEELRKIRRVIRKSMDGAPHEVLLVIDASTGQNGIQQAKEFHAAVGVSGLVVTKLDGTAKGGIVLAINRQLHLPVRFIGIGERIDDLQPFDRTSFVDALFEKEVA